MKKRTVKKTVAAAIPLVLPAGQRLDKFLTTALNALGQNISRSVLQRLIEDRENPSITGIDPKHLKASYRPKSDLEISIQLPPEKTPELVPWTTDIPVIYEDAHLAVVHKPAGMTVHPGAGTGKDTLVHALLSRLDALSEHAERPGIVHRLDRETEGLMIIAKTKKAHAAMTLAFAERRINKTYAALVWGKVSLPPDIEGFIWRDPRSRKKMRFGLEAPVTNSRAREASLEILDESAGPQATALNIRLITGRTHQIRVTCAFFNAPIIGDTLYGNDAAKFKMYKVGRAKKQVVEKGGMLLIAQSIAFVHPFTKKKLKFAIPLPERFNAVQEALS